MFFERLRLINDPVAGSGPWNMAVDEMLTQQVIFPTLRIYQWLEPTVSFGYFEKISEVRRARPFEKLIRRWTGGGLVEHGSDWTYSLIVPADHPFAREQRVESYQLIHEVLQKLVLNECGIAVEIANDGEGAGEGCFQKPVRGDLLFHGQKIAGAAQRRTRNGLLHQGSVQSIELAGLDPLRVAEAFGSDVTSIPLTDSEEKRAMELVSSRYGSAEWLERF